MLQLFPGRFPAGQSSTSWLRRPAAWSHDGRHPEGLRLQAGLSLIKNVFLCRQFAKSRRGRDLKLFTAIINGTARFFAFSLIIDGITNKVFQFIMPLKPIYNRNFGFIEQKIYFEHYRQFQARNTLLIDIIFAMKKISVDLFRAAPYMLMLVLHKDVLFHSGLYKRWWVCHGLLLPP